MLWLWRYLLLLMIVVPRDRGRADMCEVVQDESERDKDEQYDGSDDGMVAVLELSDRPIVAVDDFDHYIVVVVLAVGDDARFDDNRIFNRGPLVNNQNANAFLDILSENVFDEM